MAMVPMMVPPRATTAGAARDDGGGLHLIRPMASGRRLGRLQAHLGGGRGGHPPLPTLLLANVTIDWDTTLRRADRSLTADRPAAAVSATARPGDGAEPAIVQLGPADFDDWAGAAQDATHISCGECALTAGVALLAFLLAVQTSRY